MAHAGAAGQGLDVVGQGVTRVAAPRWGQPGTPLLPDTARAALADEALPGWLVDEFGLAPGATAGALDASVWARLEQVSSRVERFVRGLVASRRGRLSLVRVAGSWPAHDRPREVD